MASVVIYSTKFCPFCDRAKALFDKKGVSYSEVRVDLDADVRTEMMEKSGRRTVPQIFINDRPIGGFDELWALETQGKLDRLLIE
jgi:glutaredoxin 3